MPTGCLYGCLALFAVAFLGFGALWIIVPLMMRAPHIDERTATERLMTALSQNDFVEADELLKLYAEPFGAPEKVKAWIEGDHLQPKSWIIEAPTQVWDTHDHDISGTVIFADGTSGTVQARLYALGLIENPWRFKHFILQRGSGAGRAAAEN